MLQIASPPDFCRIDQAANARLPAAFAQQRPPAPYLPRVETEDARERESIERHRREQLSKWRLADREWQQRERAHLERLEQFLLAALADDALLLMEPCAIAFGVVAAPSEMSHHDNAVASDAKDSKDANPSTQQPKPQQQQRFKLRAIVDPLTVRLTYQDYKVLMDAIASFIKDNKVCSSQLV